MQLEGNGWLGLAEVEVIGTPLDPEAFERRGALAVPPPLTIPPGSGEGWAIPGASGLPAEVEQ